MIEEPRIPQKGEYWHVPVLREEVLDALRVRSGGRYVDCTLGEGGHSASILGTSGGDAYILGFDADPEAISIASERLRPWGRQASIVNENFKNLRDLLDRQDFGPVDGVLFDLGLSSLQLDGESRGFSFRKDAPLDMRFDPRQQLTAFDVVNSLSREQLESVIRLYGEETRARRISRALVEAREVRGALEAAAIVAKVVGRRGRIHPATRTFQAIRIFVNGELENLSSGLRQAVRAVRPGGRVAVISYHSLEDRIVKEIFKEMAKTCICPIGFVECRCCHHPELKILTKKPVRPSAEEVSLNPRSRSARMRVAEHV
jgi:16S rRNA (cytosine1402-N4)-methyltransferase